MPTNGLSVADINPSHVLAVVGLYGGLSAVMLAPLPSPALNLLVGAALLWLGFGSVLYMVTGFGDRGERGSEF